MNDTNVPILNILSRTKMEVTTKVLFGRFLFKYIIRLKVSQWPLVSDTILYILYIDTILF